MGDFFIAYKKLLLYIDIRSCVCTIYHIEETGAL